MFHSLLRLCGGRPTLPERVLPDFVHAHASALIDHTVCFRPHESCTIDIGEKAVVWRGCEMCGPVSIGARVFLNRDVYLRPFTTIEEDVSVGPFVKFVTDSHEISDVHKRAGKSIYSHIRVERGAWIGAGAMILGGVVIGSGAIVGAGAIVTRDVPPNTLVVGAPAQVIRQLNPLTRGEPKRQPTAMAA